MRNIPGPMINALESDASDTRERKVEISMPCRDWLVTG